MATKPPYLILLITLIFVLSNIPPVRADDTGQIGLVVQFGDGTTITRCIDGDGLTGYDLLQLSGFEVIASFSNAGTAICKIGGDGCPAENCFCQHPPNYWSYWHLLDGNWVYSPMGASSYPVSAGSVEGWRWGQGDPPPVISFDSICAPPPTEPPTATIPPPTPTIPPPTATVQQPTVTKPQASPTTSSPDTDQLSSATVTTTQVPISETPSFTPSPNPTKTTVVSPSDTPIPLVMVEPEPEEQYMETDAEPIAATEGQQTNHPSATPVQYVFFGIITLLLGGILTTFVIRQRKA
jgi:hypothetical protein